jgi:hypothetical protein
LVLLLMLLLLLLLLLGELREREKTKLDRGSY